MDFSPTQLYSKDSCVPQECKPLQQWGYPDSEGYSSLSPASSTDSYSFSPPYQPCTFSNEAYSSFHTALTQMEMLKSMPKPGPVKKSHRNRMVYNQRQSASEREKMRMRNLSTALQNLRRYLPPAVAPVGKTLTKIETLRLTIRYISHLSEVLGLDEETLIKRREESIQRSSMCPIGLSCCQDRMHNACTDPRIQFSETLTSPHFPGGSKIFSEHNSYKTMGTKFQLSAPQTIEGRGPVQGVQMKTFPSCVPVSTPISETVTEAQKEEFSTASPISPDLGFCQNFIDDMWEELQEKDLWTSFQPPEIAQSTGFC
ncbi:uncharacterized protein WCC33_006450 [Rhinophrynus dorsalis]